MAEVDAIVMECGFCLLKDSAMVEPKVLPCSHAHCLRCLTTYFNLNSIVRCPTCREVYDVALGSLMGGNTACCNICTAKGKRNQRAVMYCLTCSKEYCSKHEEHHDEILADHSKIGINEYRKQAMKLEVRECAEHGRAFCLGCKTCLTIACMHCTSSMGACADGNHHELISLDNLVDGLTKDIHELKTGLINKEDKLDGLFKKTSEIVADHGAGTVEMVAKIRQKRDEQIEAIMEKYEILEKELIESREKCKEALIKFMEDDVGVKLADLSKNRLKIEARVKHSHQVDIVNWYKDSKEDMQKFLEDEMPILELEMMTKIDIQDYSRSIELSIDCAGYGYLDWESGLITSKPIPKSMKLLQAVAVPSNPRSVFSHRGYTYTGMNNQTVSRIDGNRQLLNSFLTLAGCVEGIVVYRDRVYKLVYGSPFSVNVHSLSGQLITSWSHTDTTSQFTKMAIVGNQIVIPDRQSQRLALYSLTGQILKYIPCPQISNGYVAICAVDSDSIVVSNYSTSQVFRMNISTGEVMWTCAQISYPLGVVCYGRSCVLVMAESNQGIQVLDIKTGTLLSTLNVAELHGNTHVFDLHISGKTLLIPAHDLNQVLFYQLE